MSTWHLLWIVPITSAVGFFVCGLCKLSTIGDIDFGSYDGSYEPPEEYLPENADQPNVS